MVIMVTEEEGTHGTHGTQVTNAMVIAGAPTDEDQVIQELTEGDITNDIW